MLSNVHPSLLLTQSVKGVINAISGLNQLTYSILCRTAKFNDTWEWTHDITHYEEEQQPEAGGLPPVEDVNQMIYDGCLEQDNDDTDGQPFLSPEPGGPWAALQIGETYRSA